MTPFDFDVGNVESLSNFKRSGIITSGNVEIDQTFVHSNLHRHDNAIFIDMTISFRAVVSAAHFTFGKLSDFTCEKRFIKRNKLPLDLKL